MPLPGQESPEENYASHVIAAGQEANDLLNAENPWLPETLESLQMINKTPASVNSAITALKKSGKSYLPKDVLTKLLEKAIHIKTEDSQIQKLLSATNTPLRTSNSLLFKKTTVSPLNRIALSNNHNNNNNDFSINNNEIQRPIMPPFANAQAALKAANNAFETHSKAAKATAAAEGVLSQQISRDNSKSTISNVSPRSSFASTISNASPRSSFASTISNASPRSSFASTGKRKVWDSPRPFRIGGKHNNRSHKKNKKHNRQTKRLRRRS